MNLPKDIMTFEKWWTLHKSLYSSAGVSREVASTIWNAAISSIEISLLEMALKR